MTRWPLDQYQGQISAGVDGPATRSIALRVTDDGGLGEIATATVEITNVAPTVTISGVPWSGEIVGREIVLTAPLLDPGLSDTHVVEWTVTRGGNPVATGTGTEFSFVPTRAGRYLVGATATDDDGGVGTEVVTITAEGDLGAIDFLLLENLSLAGGSLFYRVETTHDGAFSLQIDAPKPSKSARLKLYDANPVETTGLTPLVKSSLDEDGNQPAVRLRGWSVPGVGGRPGYRDRYRAQVIQWTNEP